MKTVRSFYDKYHMEIGNIVLILVLAIVLFPRLSADYVLHQFVIIVLLTMGLSLEMLSGVLDFAFMAEIAMTTCLGGLCLRAGFPVWVSLTVMILAQMLFGMAKGLLIGKIRVNPILLTFILQQIYQGIAAVFGDAIQAPIPKNYYGSYMFWMIFSGIAVVIYVFLQLLLTHTYYGKYVRMLGENETSVKNSGIRFDICRMIICGISGIVFAQVALIFLFITNGGSAGIGRRYLYQVIAAACLGGINFLKGKGNLRGTVLGSLSMVLLLNLSAGLSLYSYFSYIWEIAILVIAVVIFARERKN